MAIGLYESNAGHLSIIDEDTGTGYTGLELTDSGFAGDAAALAAGDTGGWSVGSIGRDGVEGCNLIATWIDGAVTVERQPSSGLLVAGIAGRQYLGIADEDQQDA